jgi:hypothetical protein
MTSAQERLDQVRATSGQRLLLVLLAVATPVMACLAIGAAASVNPSAVCVAVAILALWAALRPDAHTDIFVLVVVVGFWLARIDDVVSPWAILVAFAMLGHHVVMAMMASAPHSAVFDATIVRRWLWRTGVVAVATVGVWAVAYALHRRHAAGNATLSLAALSALVVATLALRARSLTRR